MWGSSDGRFFRSHSWRGRLRPVFRVRPIPLSFWGNVPPLQWGHFSHGSLTSDYIAITSFLRVTGCPLFAAVSAQNIQSQTDQQSHINDGKFGMFSEGGRKFIGLEKNSHVCLAIYDKYDGFGNLRSLQDTGIAAMVEPFSEEYNAHAAFKKIPLDALKKLPSPMNLICVTPTRIDALFSDFKKDGYSVRQVLHRLS